MSGYACIDIGGTTIKNGLYDPRTDILKTFPEIVTQDGKGTIPAKVRQIIGQLSEQAELRGIAISTGGVVDPERGVIIAAADTIPGYAGTCLKEPLEQEFGIPVTVENDVNCAGLAEYHARQAGSLACLTIGTGIGGAYIQDGKLLRGFSNSAMEVGYLILPGGSFEKIAATSALVRQVEARKKLSRGSLDGRKITALAASGDRDARAALRKMAADLAAGIANICFILNPEVVVLGGGIMTKDSALLPAIDSELDRRLFPELRKSTRLEAARYGNEAGMRGAYWNFRSCHPEAGIK